VTAEWLSSTLPRNRDHRINGLFDFACGAYGLLGDGETIREYQISVVNGQGHAALIIKDGQGLRRITITDERVGAGEAGAA
jgi:hypothetical protein